MFYQVSKMKDPIFNEQNTLITPNFIEPINPHFLEPKEPINSRFPSQIGQMNPNSLQQVDQMNSDSLEKIGTNLNYKDVSPEGNFIFSV